MYNNRVQTTWHLDYENGCTYVCTSNFVFAVHIARPRSQISVSTLFFFVLFIMLYGIYIYSRMKSTVVSLYLPWFPAGHWLGANWEACVWAGLQPSLLSWTTLMLPNREQVHRRYTHSYTACVYLLPTMIVSLVVRMFILGECLL